MGSNDERFILGDSPAIVKCQILAWLVPLLAAAGARLALHQDDMRSTRSYLQSRLRSQIICRFSSEFLVARAVCCQITWSLVRAVSCSATMLDLDVDGPSFLLGCHICFKLKRHGIHFEKHDFSCVQKLVGSIDPHQRIVPLFLVMLARYTFLGTKAGGLQVTSGGETCGMNCEVYN